MHIINKTQKIPTEVLWPVIASAARRAGARASWPVTVTVKMSKARKVINHYAVAKLRKGGPYCMNLWLLERDVAILWALFAKPFTAGDDVFWMCVHEWAHVADFVEHGGQMTQERMGQYPSGRRNANWSLRPVEIHANSVVARAKKFPLTKRQYAAVKKLGRYLLTTRSKP